ncbi:MAG: PEGA domain-containing protein [Myxococcota bacterium]
MYSLLDPRTPAIRVIAVLVAVCILNLDFALVAQGRLEPQVASAQGKERRVALFVLPKNSAVEGDAQVLQTLLRTEVSRLAGVRLITGTPEPDASVENQVGPAIEDGVRALNSKDDARAEEYLSEAYEALIRNTGPLPRRAMARTLKGLGVARVMGGQLRAGQEMMRASLNLWPDQQPPEYAYSLDVLNAFKTVQQQHVEGTTGGVAVITEPAGARVSVGGEVKGYATLKVGDLPAGLHWIEATLDGYERSGAFVEIRGGEETTHRFALQPRANSASYEALIDEGTRYVRSKKKMGSVLPGLNALLGSEEIIFVTADGKGSAYAFRGWYQSAAGMAPVKVTVNRDAQFLTSLQQFMAVTLNAETAEDEVMLPLDAPPRSSEVSGGSQGSDDLFIDPSDSILKSEGGAEGQSVIETWWFWTIIGSALAGIGVGLGVALSGEEAEQGPVGDVLIQLNSF